MKVRDPSGKGDDQKEIEDELKEFKDFRYIFESLDSNLTLFSNSKQLNISFLKFIPKLKDEITEK